MLEPVGDLESTFMAATICAVIVNSIQAVVGSKEKQRAFSPTDFMPKWGTESEETEELSLQPKVETVDEMKKLFKQLAADSAKRRRAVNKPPPVRKRKVVGP